MEFSDYLIFLSASVILCVTPGPDMIYVLSRSVAQGKKAGIVASLGINLGAYTHLFAAILGISAILATSSFAFTIVKWAGAAYLIFIGIQALRSRTFVFNSSGEAETTNFRTIFWQGYLSDVLNPKVAIFFLAFLPQFIETGSENYFYTLLVLGFTVNTIGILTNLVLVVCSSYTTRKLRENESLGLVLQRAMGGVFVALGLRLANEKI